MRATRVMTIADGTVDVEKANCKGKISSMKG